MDWGLFFKFYSFFVKYKPNKNRTKPWPISPNITPNRNGKVIIVNIPGFISLYRGTP